VGKFLVSVAEAISRMYGCDLVTIISGVGVRDYYEHLGYTLDSKEDQFMIKYLTNDNVKQMVLFGKEYDYVKIEKSLMGSIISTKYIQPFDVDVPEYDTSVDSKIYTNIQNGEAQGFSFRSSEKPILPSEQHINWQNEVIINMIIFVVTFMILHIVFFHL
jgi:hypothetical protein